MASSFLSFDKDAYRARILASNQEFDEESRDPLGLHRWARLVNLTTTAMNGKLVEVLFPLNEDGRIGVRVAGEAATKAIKPLNLSPLPDEETSKVCRLAADGEDQSRCKRALKIQGTRWPNEVLAGSSFEESPLSKLLGIPLRITRVAPRSKLTERAHFDNLWTTWMMIHPVSGLAPLPWQSHIGAVVVWREGGSAVSANDVCLFNDYLSDLLDRYSDCTVNPQRDLTPANWIKEKENILEIRRLNVEQDPFGMMESYDDINI